MPDDDTILIGRVARRARDSRPGDRALRRPTSRSERFRAGAELLVVQERGTVDAGDDRDGAVPAGPADRRVRRASTTMNDAESAGRRRAADSGERARAAARAGTFHHHDLIGCEVRDTQRRADRARDARSRGRWSGAGWWSTRRRGEVQIPLADGICRRASTRPARRIVVDPPEGLLELNLPARPR